MPRIVPHTVPRVGRSYEHFPDGFELHLLPPSRDVRTGSWTGPPRGKRAPRVEISPTVFGVSGTASEDPHPTPGARLRLGGEQTRAHVRPEGQPQTLNPTP